ncbi:MAG TPA: ABC transporter ATP-binding protein [Mycobacteriales bacterium]|nr:ABC transporter ATP-binding protein [Mycobacteriales bacterium]
MPDAEEPTRSATAPLSTPSWLGHGETVTGTSFLSMLRRLPALLAGAARLGWWASRRDTVLAVVLTVTGGAFTAVGVLATTNVAAALLTAGPTADRVRSALPALLTVAAALGLRSALGTAAGWAQARLEPRVLAVAEVRFVELTTSVEVAAFDDPGFADEMQRASERGTQSAGTLVREGVDLLSALVGVIAAMSALFVVHPLLVPLMVLAVAPVGWASVRAARIQYASLFRRIARRRRMWVLERLMAERDTAAELRTYGMRGFLLDQHRAVITAEIEADLEVVRGQTVSRAVGAALSGVAGVGVWTVLGLLIATGRVPLAAAASGVVALQTVRGSLQLAVLAVNTLYEEALYFADYSDFAARAAARLPAAPTRPAPGPFAELTLERVGLRYPGSARTAVEDLSLTVRAGETIALVGENGSGKTTVARLLAMLWAPDSGTVRWDGVPVGELPRDALRRHIAVVGQDVLRWPFTARENVQVGDVERPDADGRRAVAAATVVGADAMIRALTRGYDTLLDRTFVGGQELSGGEWQRLAAARATFRDAPLLICDEPSAALDARAEHALFAQLRSRGQDRTTVLVSHRLANVRHVDRIYVLHQGRLVEAGDHDELMAAGGRYAELFTLQAAGYR